MVINYNYIYIRKEEKKKEDKEEQLSDQEEETVQQMEDPTIQIPSPEYVPPEFSSEEEMSDEEDSLPIQSHANIDLVTFDSLNSQNIQKLILSNGLASIAAGSDFHLEHRSYIA